MKIKLSPLASRLQTAFTLIECIVYCGVLFLVLGLAFATYYRANENHRNLRRNAADIVRVLQAGERWREDIRRATGPIQLAGTGAAQELTIPHTNGAVKYTFRQGSVWRQTGPRTEEVLPNVAGSQMQNDPRQRVTAWRWEVELQSKKHVARVRPLFTFEAAAPQEEKR